MKLLRDLRESTRLLFLYEVIANRHTRLRTIAERLDMPPAERLHRTVIEWNATAPFREATMVS